MAMNLVHQTVAEFVTRFWRRVDDAKSSDQARFHYLIWWLMERITAGDINDALARGSFNAHYGRAFSPTEWTAFKVARLTPMHDRWAAVMAEGAL